MCIVWFYHHRHHHFYHIEHFSEGTITVPWDMKLVKYTQFPVQAYPMAFASISIICCNNKYIVMNIKTVEQLK
jgi:hypothetical protein